VTSAWRLIPRRLVSWTVGCAIVAAAAVALLGVHYAGSARPGPLDQRLDAAVGFRLATHPHLMDQLVSFGSPRTVITVALLLGVTCLLLRRPRAAVFAVVAPLAASALTEWILKPLIDRSKGEGLAFPSGHTTGAFALALTAAVLLLPHRGGLRAPSALLRLLAAMTVVGLASGTALALVALRYHYATDTLGGALVAASVVAATALGVDQLSRVRLRPPRPPAMS
jgi:undecaprenyl-diphosphatase